MRMNDANESKNFNQFMRDLCERENLVFYYLIYLEPVERF